MDKIKDALYECSDMIMGFFILISMVCIMGWQLYDWFDPSPEFNFSSASASSVETSPKSPDIPAELESDLPEVDSESADSTKIVQTDIPRDTSEAAPVDEIVIFKIERGSACIHISKDLQSMGLINSGDEFVARITSLKLENKLKSGTYSIKKGDSMDNIIKTLTD